MDNRPRLVPPGPHHPPNVLIAYGLPWYLGEEEAKVIFTTVYGVPKTCRCYDDPLNGSSRGIFFLEYDATGSIDSISSIISSNQQCPLSLYHLTNAAVKWERGGRLPDLPSDAAQLAQRPLEGYGPEGYVVRCGSDLGMPNTVTQPESLERYRKRTYQRFTAATWTTATQLVLPVESHACIRGCLLIPLLRCCTQQARSGLTPGPLYTASTHNSQGTSLY